MMKNLKKIIKRCLHLAGLELKFATPVGVDELKWLKELNIRTVIDIGASKGNSVVDFRRLFPDAFIYAFEPLQDCFLTMTEKLKNMPKVKLYNIALSDIKSQAIIHRSSYSGSSSLREMADIHKEAFPITAGATDSMVQTDTLDNVLGSHDLKDNILIKIDVQGLEDKVILGGLSVIDRSKILIIETSFIELYKGQPLFGDVCKLLERKGFQYRGAMGKDFRDPRNGISLQQDSVFLKR